MKQAPAVYVSSQPPSTARKQRARTSSLAALLTHAVQRLCAANRKRPMGVAYAVFYSTRRQPFALRHYVERLLEYCECTTRTLLVAAAHLERAQHTLPTTDRNCHRMLAAALLLAIRDCEREVFADHYYARVFGVDTHELAVIEREMRRILCKR